MLEMKVIKRPELLIYSEVEILFNFKEISILEIDLEHINKGKNKTRNNRLNAEEVVKIVTALISDLNLLFTDFKQFENDFCYYYSKIGNFNNKRFKLIFCICSDRPKTIGVITLFRVRGNYESL